MKMTKFLPSILLASVIAVLLESTTAAAMTIPSEEEHELPDQRYADKPACEDKLSEGNPFCTKLQNYSKLNELTKINSGELSRYEVFFGVDELPPINISTVISSTKPDEEFLCESESTIIYPEAAMTKDSTWLLVVNNFFQYKQGVRVDICKRPGSQCRLIDFFPHGYKASCKQVYTYRPLIAISENGTLIRENFKFPSCCQCGIRLL